eukprot:IDg1921t1
MRTVCILARTYPEEEEEAMKSRDFTIGKVTRRHARDSGMLSLALRSTSMALKAAAIAQAMESGNDLERAQRRVADISASTFNFNGMSEQQCLIDLRFRRANVPQIAALINWEGPTLRNRYTCDSLTATCIFLRRLSFPCRWRDLERTFGMQQSKLSEVFWEVAGTLYKEKGHLLTSFRKDVLQERAALYAEAVADRGGGLSNCVGFIDGTKIDMCRPGGADVNQRVNYSGHKRKHCLGYQTITVPDGLILHMHGPTEGRQPDVVMYSRSNVDELLRDSLLIAEKQYCIYGDAAYRLRPWLCTAYPRRTATEDQVAFNKSMNAVRTCVEWSYGELKQSFTAIDFRRANKLRQAPYRPAVRVCRTSS